MMEELVHKVFASIFIVYALLLAGVIIYSFWWAVSCKKMIDYGRGHALVCVEWR